MYIEGMFKVSEFRQLFYKPHSLIGCTPIFICHLVSRTIHVITELRQTPNTDASSTSIDIAHIGNSRQFTLEHVHEFYIYQHAATRAPQCPPERSSRRDLRPDHPTRGTRCLKERLQRRSPAYSHSFRDTPSSDSTTLPATGGPERSQRTVADEQANHLHPDGEHAEPGCKSRRL